MAVRNIKRVRPTIWIPPNSTADYKVTVEKGGVEEDITELIINLIVEDSVTDGIGTFEFEIPNPDESYSNKWTGMEIFRYYKDYSDSVPTTLRFRGRIEKPSKQGCLLQCSGRSESLYVMDESITLDYEDTDVGVILKALFDAYGNSRFDVSEIPLTTGITMTVKWISVPFWDVVEILCGGSGYDCYISPSLIVKFFEAGSISNSTDAIVHEYNLIETEDFAQDIQQIKNKVRVYGATIDGVQIIYTANNITSQNTYGVRTEEITDESITTFDEAKELAEYNVTAIPPDTGRVKGLLLATIQPGEKIKLSDPLNGLSPDTYRCVHYKDELGDSGLFTTVTINKETVRLSHVMKNRIRKESQLQDTTGNINDMDFACIELFNSDSGSHTNTEMTNGVLKKETLGADANWVSGTIDSPGNKNIYEMEIKVEGENLSGALYEVSADNGVNYMPMVKGTKYTMASMGKKLKYKITFTDDSTQIDSFCVMFKTK